MSTKIILTLFVGLFATGSLAYAQEAAPSSAPAAETQQDEYVLNVQDSVNVTVWENADLTGKFVVQPDGAIMLPLVGRVKAAGLSVRGFEAQLTRAEIRLPVVTSRLLDGKVGYVALTHFDAETSKDVQRAMEALRDQHQQFVRAVAERDLRRRDAKVRGQRRLQRAAFRVRIAQDFRQCRLYRRQRPRARAQRIFV